LNYNQITAQLLAQLYAVANIIFRVIYITTQPNRGTHYFLVGLRYGIWLQKIVTSAVLARMYCIRLRYFAGKNKLCRKKV